MSWLNSLNPLTWFGSDNASENVDDQIRILSADDKNKLVECLRALKDANVNQSAATSDARTAVVGRNVVTTSPVDVSTILPPNGNTAQSGGFVYNRNRYQELENKVQKYMRGGNMNPNMNSNMNLQKKSILTEESIKSDINEINEINRELSGAMSGLMQSLQNPMKILEDARANKKDDSNNGDVNNTTQNGGMTVDKEIENIRNFLLETKHQQNGGSNMNMSDMYLNIDPMIAQTRDNLLNNNGSLDMVGGNFSATSSFADVDNMIGGANFSATSSFADADNMIGGANFSATSPFSNTMIGGANFSATSEQQIDYDLLMNGGAKNKKVVKTKKNKHSSSSSSSSSSSLSTSGSDDDSSDSSNSDSSSSSESDSSSASEVDMEDLMRLQRGIDKRQNRSNFLRGDYVVTSNSDNNYQIDGRPFFSSQSTDQHNGVGSEFLNTMRARSRN
jgi:hypothetical protein